MEDRFFATIFLGSGLLFLSVLFLVSAFVGGILVAFEAKPEELIGSATFHFARAPCMRRSTSIWSRWRACS
jgi:hypothetical protein